MKASAGGELAFSRELRIFDRLPAPEAVRHGLLPKLPRAARGAGAVGRIQLHQVEAMTAIEAQGTWTTERIALLKNRMEAGLSCAEIAREIGVSRNAVIGKANRLGLSRSRHAIAGHAERKGTRNNGRPKTSKQVLRALWTEPQPGAAEAPSTTASRRSLFELQHWHCRWPLGDPASEDFAFCGNKPVEGLPYCPSHARMAYRSGARIPHHRGESAGKIQDRGATRDDTGLQDLPMPYAAAMR